MLQENGDIFAFDEPFNNFFKHSVPPASPQVGRRISIILFVNEPLATRIRIRSAGGKSTSLACCE